MPSKVLIFSDSPLHFSGVASQVKHIVSSLLKSGFEVVCLSIAQAAPGEPPRVIVQSAEGNYKRVNIESFDNIQALMNLLQEEKPDLLLLFQDPHFYISLFQHMPAIRKSIPVAWVVGWDTWLVPQCNGTSHFNLPFYESVDGLAVMSHQSEKFITNVLSKRKYGTSPYIEWVGHGRPPNIFKPLTNDELVEAKKKLAIESSIDFIVLVNNKNQHRKKIPDTIEAFRLFNESLSTEEAKKTLLILHTQISPHPRQAMIGTDLNAVCLALAPDCNIIIDPVPCNEEQLNQLYNLADVFVNPANAEGWGLTSHEAILTGTPVILNHTGGLKDQGADFKSDWCYTLPNQRTIIGSPATPYLYEENCSIESIKDGMLYWYNTPKQERERKGMLGRQFMLDKQLTSEAFGNRVVNVINKTMANFKPQPLFNLYAE